MRTTPTGSQGAAVAVPCGTASGPVAVGWAPPSGNAEAGASFRRKRNPSGPALLLGSVAACCNIVAQRCNATCRRTGLSCLEAVAVGVFVQLLQPLLVPVSTHAPPPHCRRNKRRCDARLRGPAVLACLCMGRRGAGEGGKAGALALLQPLELGLRRDVFAKGRHRRRRLRAVGVLERSVNLKPCLPSARAALAALATAADAWRDVGACWLRGRGRAARGGKGGMMGAGGRGVPPSLPFGRWCTLGR